ncbi:MAG: hypothetical protein ABJL72_18370 [Roseobacter sp.]
MSDTDSFIDEVTEEVKRDQFYGMLRKYGWIVALVIVLIVGGAAFSEYRKAQARAVAEGLGDQILTSLAAESPADRQTDLEAIATPAIGGQTIVAFLAAAEAQQAGDIDQAVALLEMISVNGDVELVYRQIAAFKSLVLQADTMDADARRQQLDALAVPGAPLSLLAQEQLALMDVAQGQTDAAIERFQNIIQDAGVSSDLQQRALQVIVALGGTPEYANLPDLGN